MNDLYMRRALGLARIGLGSVKSNPMVGAVVVHNDNIIGEGWHKKFGGPHAEVEAIASVKDKELLKHSTLYVTLEPCAMCSGAIILSRIDKVVYGASDPKGGCAGTFMNLLQDDRFNHQSEVIAGVMEEECGSLLTTFFKELRLRKKEKKNKMK